MMLDLSPKATYIDHSGDGHIMAKEIQKKVLSQKETEEHTADTRADGKTPEPSGQGG